MILEIKKRRLELPNWFKNLAFPYEKSSKLKRCTYEYFWDP